MPYVDVNNIKMFYEKKGHGEPLLLINGLSANHKTWDKIENELAEHFTLILPDNRGSGKTSQPESDYTIEQMASDTVELMNAIGIDSAHILGHSMGGCILQQICLDYPEKVKKTIIAGSTAKNTKILTRQFNNSIALTAAGTDIALIINNVIPWLYANQFLENEQNIAQEIQRMLTETDPQTFAGFLGQVKALGAFDVLDRLSTIQQNTLIISGAEDILILPKYQHQLKERIPNSIFAQISDCGHMFQREKPQELVQLILNFII